MAEALAWEAWATLGILVAIIVALAKEIARPDMVFLTGLALLLLCGILTPEQAFAGFSNPAVLTIASLFVVSGAVQQTGALRFIKGLFFSKTRQPGWRLLRLMAPTAVFSAFLNNTPIVAMVMPEVQQWAEQKRIPSSRLLIPLSYAAIVGGMVTLIGTSTNILVSGILEEEGYASLGLFDFAYIGIPVAGAVLAYFYFIGHRFLPDRGVTGDQLGNGLTSCLFELRVQSNAPFKGQTIEEAGLRSLRTAYLVHIQRNTRLVPAAPDSVLEAEDVLTFVGSVEVLEELLRRPGFGRVVLANASDSKMKLPLYEAVVSSSSKLVGKTLRESNFREVFGGVVLAIRRHDEAILDSLGGTVIRSGDLLLIEAKQGFAKRWNARRDEFYLVALYHSQAIGNGEHGKPDLIATVLLLTMVAVMAMGWTAPATIALLTALGMIVTQCITLEEARQSVHVQVLVLIVAALGFGEAVQTTGVASAIADVITYLAALSGISVVLVLLYLTTNGLTELVTNNAAAVLMMPIALDVATELNVDVSVLAIVVALAASASFMTPIGYQTNLMVMAAGRYRFLDYTQVGFPVSVMVFLIVIVISLGQVHL